MKRVMTDSLKVLCLDWAESPSGHAAVVPSHTPFLAVKKSAKQYAICSATVRVSGACVSTVSTCALGKKHAHSSTREEICGRVSQRCEPQTNTEPHM